MSPISMTIEQRGERVGLVFAARVEAACVDRLTEAGVPSTVVARVKIVPSVTTPIMLHVTMDGTEWVRTCPFTCFPTPEMLNEILILA